MRVDWRSISVGRGLQFAAVFALALTACGDGDTADDTKPVQGGGGTSPAAEGSHTQSGGDTGHGTAATPTHATTGGASHSSNSTVAGLSGGSKAVGTGGSALSGSGGQSNVGAGSNANGGTTRLPNSTGGVGQASFGGSAPVGTGGIASVGGSAPTTKGNRDVLKPLAKEFCAAATNCCKKDGLSAELSDCESAYLKRQPAAASIERGTVTVNSATLASCVAAYQSASTHCTAQELIEACQDVFLGVQGEGQACANGYECSNDKGPSVCLFAGSNSEPGVCKVTPQGREGDPCASTCALGQDCSYEVYGAADSILTQCFEADGLYCDYMSGNPACARLILLGGDCSMSDACGSDNVCDVTCKKRSTLGQPCGSGCVSELMCVEGICSAPPLANESVCVGNAPAP